MVGEEKIVKAWPAEIDDWGHFLHGPDNNAVAQDRRVGIPRSIQWVAEPRWGRTHEEMASLSAAVSAGGRVYYIVDEAPLASIRFLGNWKLVAAGQDGPWELYDLGSDRTETSNFAQRHPEKLRELSEAWTQRWNAFQTLAGQDLPK